MIISCGSDQSSQEGEATEVVEEIESIVGDNAVDLSTEEIRNLLHGTWTMRGQTLVIEPGGTAQFREVYKEFEGEWMEGSWELEGTSLLLVLKDFEQINQILGINDTTLRMRDQYDRSIIAKRE